MLNKRLASDHLHGKLLFTWLSLVMSMMVSFCAVLFPTRCLGWDLELNWVSFWGFSYLFRRIKVTDIDICNSYPSMISSPPPSLNLFIYLGGESRDIYTYIRTERVKIFVIISLMLNEFSYGKAQIPHRFCSRPLFKRCFQARSCFPHNLEQRRSVFARGWRVETYSA